MIAFIFHPVRSFPDLFGPRSKCIISREDAFLLLLLLLLRSDGGPCRKDADEDDLITRACSNWAPILFAFISPTAHLPICPRMRRLSRRRSLSCLINNSNCLAIGFLRHKLSVHRAGARAPAFEGLVRTSIGPRLQSPALGQCRGGTGLCLGSSHPFDASPRVPIKLGTELAKWETRGRGVIGQGRRGEREGGGDMAG